jgi:hypothetical protein
MKKIMVAVALCMVCSGVGFAESMSGKIGVGMRSNTFDARYFITENIGVHAGTAMYFMQPSSSAQNVERVYVLGGFYSKEITDGLFFQTGLTVTRDGGRSAGIKYTTWIYNPYLGAEFVYKGRFGLDFKVIPVQYGDNRQKGNNFTAWSCGLASLGAHIYFH